VQTCERCVTKTVYDKKHWNAVARYLFDSCWDHYAFSRSHWRNRNGDLGAHNRHFDLGRQIVFPTRWDNVSLHLAAAWIGFSEGDGKSVGEGADKN